MLRAAQNKFITETRPGAPVVLLARFEMVVLKTAKTLGRIVPPTPLARADEVIK